MRRFSKRFVLPAWNSVGFPVRRWLLVLAACCSGSVLLPSSFHDASWTACCSNIVKTPLWK